MTTLYTFERRRDGVRIVVPAADVHAAWAGLEELVPSLGWKLADVEDVSELRAADGRVIGSLMDRAVELADRTADILEQSAARLRELAGDDAPSSRHSRRVGE